MQHCNDSLNDTSSTPTSFFSPVLSESERLNLLQSVSTTVNNRRMRSGRPPSSSSSSSSSSCKETTTSLVLMDDNAVAKSANANNNDVGSKENTAIENSQRGMYAAVDMNEDEQYQIEQQEGQKKEVEHENDNTCKKCGEKGAERRLCCSV